VIRKQVYLAAVVALAATALPAAASARMEKPRIEATEVGYFGSALIAHRINVFVYANLGPSAGNRVTVCVRGVCEHARGHNARTAWYSAAFTTAGLRMGDPVTYTAIASDAAGRSKVTATGDLLCMHNNGSTPQR
jgi:hypothetical protein